MSFGPYSGAFGGLFHDYGLFWISPYMYLYEPADDKNYNKTYVISKDSYQPVHPPNMARILVHPSLDSMEAIEGTCNQQRL